MASKHSSLSPYNYSFNQPNQVVDVDGADPYGTYNYSSYYSNNYTGYTYDDRVDERFTGVSFREGRVDGFYLSATGYGNAMFGMGAGWYPGQGGLSGHRGISGAQFSQMHQAAQAARGDAGAMQAYGARYGTSISIPQAMAMQGEYNRWVYANSPDLQMGVKMELFRQQTPIPTPSVRSEPMMNLIASTSAAAWMFELTDRGGRTRTDAPWMAWAVSQIGTQELLEDGTLNPQIRKYFATTNYEKLGFTITTTTPWCAAFANWCFQNSSVAGSGSAHSSLWADDSWGYKLDKPRYGAVGVNSDGHTAFYYGESNGYVMALGGNQSNQVKITENWWKVSDFTWYWPNDSTYYSIPCH